MVRSGFNPASLPALYGHNQAPLPLPVIFAKEAQAVKFFSFFDQIWAEREQTLEVNKFFP